MPIVRRVAAAVLFAAVVAGAVRFGTWPTLAVVVVSVALVALSWPWLLALPHPRGAAIAMLVAGVIGSGLMAARVLPTDSSAILVALGALLLAAFVWQLTRRDGRHDLVRSVIGVVAGGMVALTSLAWLPIARTPDLHPWAWLALAAVAAGCLVRIVPAGSWLVGVLSLLAAAGAGCGAALALQLPIALAVPLAALIGLLVAIIVPVGTPFDALGAWRSAALAAALPVAASGTLTLFYCQLLVPGAS